VSLPPVASTKPADDDRSEPGRFIPGTKNPGNVAAIATRTLKTPGIPRNGESDFGERYVAASVRAEESARRRRSKGGGPKGEGKRVSGGTVSRSPHTGAWAGSDFKSYPYSREKGQTYASKSFCAVGGDLGRVKKMSRDDLGRFKTGNNGGPGRPPGSRNRLAEDFLADLCSDWRKYGAAVVATVRKEHPAVYLRTVASLIPRELAPPVQHDYSDLSDEELADRLIELGQQVLADLACKRDGDEKT
jgi:hypothetical protein